MAQTLKPISLPDTGVDWTLIQTPAFDVAINPFHFPLAFTPFNNNWCRIFENDKQIKNYLDLNNLEHFYNA